VLGYELAKSVMGDFMIKQTINHKHNPPTLRTKSANVNADPKPVDWFCLVMIIAMGGSSFALIEKAVESLPPTIITVGRLWIGAIMMTAIVLGTGRRFPPLLVKEDGQNRIDRGWLCMIVIGGVGTTIPFYIFPLAQLHVESGLAGVYMALMPIWTLGLAAMFAGEALTGRRFVGFIIGFLGVLILMGPAVFGDATQTNLLAQLGLVVATLCYAGSAVITRRAPAIRPRVFAAGSLLSAAIVATPGLLFTDWRLEQWELTGILSVFGLGIFSTGLGAFLIVVIIQRVGAGFMSFSNYITPVWAVILGAILFNERLSPNVFIALGVVIVGLAVSQSGRQP